MRINLLLGVWLLIGASAAAQVTPPPDAPEEDLPPAEVFLTMERLPAVAPAPVAPAPAAPAPGQPAVATTRPFAFIDNLARWRPNGKQVKLDANGVLEIEVCWINPVDDPADRHGRELSQTAVEETWNASGVVRFVGRGPQWTRCAEDDLGGVRIMIDDVGPRVAKIGAGTGTVDVGMWLNFTFAKRSRACADAGYKRDDCIHSLAVHEFGHVLGFRHEHVRLGMTGGRVDSITTDELAALKKTCADQGRAITEDVELPTDATTTVYDAKSVMNYCFNIYDHKAIPSALDLEGLAAAYAER